MLVFPSDKITFASAKTMRNDIISYSNCSAYRKKRGVCTSHKIMNIHLESLVLTDLRRVLALAHNDGDEFARRIKRMGDAEGEIYIYSQQKPPERRRNSTPYWRFAQSVGYNTGNYYRRRVLPPRLRENVPIMVILCP